MILTKKRLQKLEDKLQQIDNANITIRLETLTELDSYEINETGHKLYPIYYQVFITNRYNKVIEQTEYIKDKKPREILDLFYNKYPGAKVNLCFYDLRDGVKQEEAEY